MTYGDSIHKVNISGKIISTTEKPKRKLECLLKNNNKNKTLNFLGC